MPTAIQAPSGWLLALALGGCVHAGVDTSETVTIAGGWFAMGASLDERTAAIDDAVKDDHALLTFRGWSWVLEDRTGGAATRVNGQPVQGLAVLGYGDEITLGEVRFRLDRAPEANGTR